MVFEGLTAPAGLQSQRRIPLVSMPFKPFTHTPPPPVKRNVLGGPLVAEPVVIDEKAEREFAAGQLALSTKRTPAASTVGSHFHFAESNAALEFDRDAAWGLRLDVPAGTAVRFEPGIEREVALVPIAGARIVPGLRGLAAGSLDAPR